MLPICVPAASSNKITSTIAVIIKALKIHLSEEMAVRTAPINPTIRSTLLGLAVFKVKVKVIRSAPQIILDFFLPNRCGNPLIPEVKS